ncbi:MAG: hypothetical protein CL847_06980 [Crocinitomicaceae bacterium]|nr:hypothetical protein [Crocinitomicaceae bacterium]|tara:strand:+ start:315 stop:1883 length:1569 start_codon:yes stop_codon:yes gene_type:complete
MRSGIFGVIKGDSQNLGCTKPTKLSQKLIQTKNSALHGTWFGELSYPAEELLSDPEKFNMLEGPTQGFHYDPQSRKLALHVDFARQHPVFYYHKSQLFAFANSLEKLCELLKAHDIKIKADEQGASMLLTYSSILGNKTLVKGVRKLMPGYSLFYSDNKVELINRNNLQDLDRHISDKSSAIELLDSTFKSVTNAVATTNADLGADQINLLSGGIDSRMVFMQSVKASNSVSTLCFSAEGYLDHQISQQISKDYNIDYNFCNLNPGTYMMCTDSMEDYDGTINFLASAHHRFALNNFNNQGIIASGQLGNEILAEFYNPNNDFYDTLESITTMKGVGGGEKDVWNATPDSTLFKLYNRGFLYTNSAAYSTLDGTLYSPFTSKEFVKAALQLHPSLLKDHFIYLEWMKARYPESICYKWERYRVKPVVGMSLKLAKLKMSILTRFIYPLSNFRCDSMSPLQHWYKESKILQQFFSKTFEENIEQLDSVPSLESFVKQNYAFMNITNKASVLTLLLALKKYVNS